MAFYDEYSTISENKCWLQTKTERKTSTVKSKRNNRNTELQQNLYLYIRSLCYCVLVIICLYICFLKLFIVIKIITQRWLLYPFFHFYQLFLFILFTHRCQYNGILYDCHTIESFIWPYYQVQSTIFYTRKCQYQIRYIRDV